MYEIVPHKTWRRNGRRGSIPCGHWKDAGTFPPPNAKELGICVTVNWYPPAFSISLDSEEGEGRVQWRGLKCRVRCGTCGWGVGHVECCVRCGACGVLWGVGSHVGHSKVMRNCYLNSNCFDNSETMAASGEWLACNKVLATQIYISGEGKHSCLHQNSSAWLILSFTRLWIT